MSRSLERIAQVAGSTALSRVLGLVREMLAARALGAGAMNSAFLTAFTLPNLFRRFLGEGSLTGALVPVLTERLKTSGRDAVFETVNQVFSWLLIVGCGIVLFAWAVAAGAWFVPDQEPRFYAGVQFTIALMPFLIFVCGAAALAACLQVLGHFAAPAIAQIWLNIAMIVSLNVFGQQFASTDAGKVWWLCGGVLVGGVMQLATPATALWRIGWRPKWDLTRTGPVREIAVLMGPSIVGAAIYQINLASSRLFAFHLNEQAVSYINYASRLMELPMGMFAIAVTTVVFPLLASHAHSGDQVGFARALRQGARLNLAVTVPAAVGLVLLGSPIIRLLFEGGAFTSEDTMRCVPVLSVFAVALPFYSLATICTRAFHAVKDTRTPLHAAMASLLVNVGASLILPHLYGTPGLAAASNLAMVVQSLYLAYFLSRRFPEVRWSELREDVLKVLGAAILMAASILSLREPFSHVFGTGKLAGSLELGCLIPAGIGVYGVALWILRIEGREKLWELFAQRIGRRLGGVLGKRAR